MARKLSMIKGNYHSNFKKIDNFFESEHYKKLRIKAEKERQQKIDDDLMKVFKAKISRPSGKINVDDLKKL
jgi:hypothetical protein